jgi:hypothetical protein
MRVFWGELTREANPELFDIDGGALAAWLKRLEEEERSAGKPPGSQVVVVGHGFRPFPTSPVGVAAQEGVHVEPPPSKSRKKVRQIFGRQLPGFAHS